MLLDGPESWYWTVGGQERLCLRMDEDTFDLIRTLCTRVGMIMEDASVEALFLPAADTRALSAGLDRLSDASGTISAIVAAARALNRSDYVR